MVEPNFSIMIVDDDLEVRTALSEYFSGAGWQVTDCDSGATALRQVRVKPPQIIVSDMRMPGMNGMELHAQLANMGIRIPFVIVSAHGDIPTAVAATRSGVIDFIEKPFDPQEIVNLAQRVVEDAELQRQNARLREQLGRLVGLDAILVGNSPGIVDLRQNIIDVAEVNAAVLVLGETGTGKELVARALHDMSQRAGNEFVAVNCAAIPDGLFESTMFGHVKGAFTNAINASSGVFVAASEGTLFLDEIGSCPVEQQAKLLRAIESNEVIPVGSSKATVVNTRIIAATNADVRANIDTGLFREDLYYRLSTITLELPPLRTRGDDILLLYTMHLQRFAAAYGVDVPGLSDDDILALHSHNWPGNVRELRQVAERRILAARRGHGSVRGVIDAATAFSEQQRGLKEQVDSFERQFIANALSQVDGTMDDVAIHLGIARRTLNEKLVKYGLKR